MVSLRQNGACDFGGGGCGRCEPTREEAPTRIFFKVPQRGALVPTWLKGTFTISKKQHVCSDCLVKSLGFLGEGLRTVRVKHAQETHANKHK